MHRELKPAGVLEILLVDRIVETVWRLHRLARVEAGIFAWEFSRKLEDDFIKEAFSRGRSRQLKEAVALGRAFVSATEYPDALSKLQRYETTLERSLYKALHELQRLQESRLQGQPVRAPAILDVTVSSGGE